MVKPPLVISPFIPLALSTLDEAADPAETESTVVEGVVAAVVVVVSDAVVVAIVDAEVDFRCEWG